LLFLNTINKLHHSFLYQIHFDNTTLHKMRRRNENRREEWTVVYVIW
jgi:hypothetical protein